MTPNEPNDPTDEPDLTSQNYRRQAKLLWMWGYISLALAISGLIYWLFIF